jgi:hypothetical protein
MSTAYPIPRETRQITIVLAAGQTVVPFPFRIFDPADLAVAVKAPGARAFTAADFTVEVGALPAAGRITLTQPYPTGSTCRVASRRVHERATDVTLAGVIRAAALEAELDCDATVLQELRRDIDAVEADQVQVRAEVTAATDALRAEVTGIADTMRSDGAALVAQATTRRDEARTARDEARAAATDAAASATLLNAYLYDFTLGGAVADADWNN